MRCDPAERERHIIGIRAVAANQSVPAHDPDVATLRYGMLLKFGNVVRIGQAGRTEAGQRGYLLVSEARERQVEAKVLEFAELQREQFRIPAGVQRQLVVGDDVGAFLRCAQSRQFDDRHLGDAEFPRSHEPPMTGYDAVVAIDEDGGGPTELADGGGDLRDLGIGMGAGIAGVWDQRRGRTVVNHKVAIRIAGVTRRSHRSLR